MAVLVPSSVSHLPARCSSEYLRFASKKAMPHQLRHHLRSDAKRTGSSESLGQAAAWVCLAMVGAVLAAPTSAQANPMPPHSHRVRPDPGCTPERENRGRWGECRYCPLAAPDPYDIRNLDLPPDYDPTDQFECGRLEHIGFRRRCFGEREVMCRPILPEAPEEEDASGGCDCSSAAQSSAPTPSATLAVLAILMWARRRGACRR
ncbi:MAG: hypothetical protein KC619_06210 [Myxococcales bacterium]|nr:hypothetical protein [Myxococcales bacterium]